MLPRSTQDSELGAAEAFKRKQQDTSRSPRVLRAEVAKDMCGNWEMSNEARATAGRRLERPGAGASWLTGLAGD